MIPAALPARPRDWQPRWYQLVRSLARVNTPGGEHQLLDWLLRPGEARVLAFASAPSMNLVAESDAFYQALASADAVVREGAGVSLLMALCNQWPGKNLGAADLVPKVLARVDGSPVALFGTREPWLSRAHRRVSGEFAPGSACVSADATRSLEDYIRIAARHRPRVIVLGLASPRQEQVALALRNALGAPCLIVCGGQALDVLGGKVPRWKARAGRLRAQPLFVRRAVSMSVRALRSGWPQVA